jgi:hypothetical protein
MSKSRSEISRAELIAYVEDMVSDALHSGLVEPLTGLEFFLYAARPDAIQTVRAALATMPSGQSELLKPEINGDHERSSPVQIIRESRSGVLTNSG